MAVNISKFYKPVEEEMSIRDLINTTIDGIKAGCDDTWKVKPISLVDFVANVEHMNHPPLSERQSKVARDFLGDEPQKIFEEGSRYTLAVLLWGKGSGKDLLASIIHCYVTYVLLCMNKPQRYFNWPETEYLDVLNVAYSADQALGVYFPKFKEKVKKWKWLKENYCIYEEGRCVTTENVGKEVIKINEGYIEFPNYIRAVSEHSEQNSYEGYNIIFWIMDEASAFKSKTKKANAKLVYETLRTSASSRFGKRWKGMILSWPRAEVGDFTVEMYEKSLSDPSILGDTGYTWQIKPKEFYCGSTFVFEGENIPVELEDDFRLEPEMSKAKFMCKPPKVEGSFFSYTERIAQSITQRAPIFDVESVIVEHEIFDENGHYATRKQFLGKKISLFRANAHDLMLPRVAHIDGGLSSCAAGLVIAHGQPIAIKIQDINTGQFKSVNYNKVVVDAVVRWLPEKNLQVSLLNIEALLLDLVNRGVKFKKITYDQWNSQSSLETLMANRIAAEMHTITTADYGELRTAMYAGGVDLIRPVGGTDKDPYYQLIYELEHLINKNDRVDKPDEGCFAGDTKVALLDGRNLPIGEVVREFGWGKDLWVYSIDLDRQDVVPKKIKSAACTGYKKLLEVQLDNTEKIRCTENHLFMMRDGTYKKAKDLLSGDSLMPLYRSTSEWKYEQFYHPFDERYHYTHQYFCPDFLGGYLTHHCNYDSLDNRPTNLKLMSKAQHTTIHNNSTKDYTLNGKKMKEWHKSIRGTLRYYQICAKIAKCDVVEYLWWRLLKGIKGYYSVKYPEAYRAEWIKKIRKTNTGKSNKYDKGYWNSNELKERARKQSKILHSDPIESAYIVDCLRKGFDGKKHGETISTYWREGRYKPHEVWNKGLSGNKVCKEAAQKGKLTCIKNGWYKKLSEGMFHKNPMKDPKVVQQMLSTREKNKLNHKVVSVRKAGYSYVYDLEIEGTNNFALSSGVFVHNSKDLADCLAGVNRLLNNPTQKQMVMAKMPHSSGYRAGVMRNGQPLQPERTMGLDRELISQLPGMGTSNPQGSVGYDPLTTYENGKREEGVIAQPKRFPRSTKFRGSRKGMTNTPPGMKNW